VAAISSHRRLKGTRMSAENKIDLERPTFPELDPTVPDHVRDPWPLWKEARERHPVFYIPKLDMYCVTRYEDVRTILRSPDIFSNIDGNVMRTPIPDDMEIPPECPYPKLGDGIVNLDAPRHTRLRKLMQPAFLPAQVRKNANQLRAIANTLIDDFIDKGETDLVKSFSNPFPIQTITMVLGFPPEVASNVRRWTDSFFRLLATPDLSDDEGRAVWTDLLESDAYVRSHVERRRMEPADDMISKLITERSDDGSPSLTDKEIVSNVMAFIVAGSDTTAILITQLVRALHRESLWERVRDDRSLVPKVIEETLRHAGVVRALNKVVTQDTELSGVKIPAGSMVLWSLASANRDELRFPNGEKFDLDRRNTADHVAFSALRHFCIGAPLARLEAEQALGALLDRIPDMRIPDQAIEYHPNYITPAPATLLVRW
jgi:cytochrome P450